MAHGRKPGEGSHRGSHGSESSGALSKGKERLESLPVVGKLMRSSSSESTNSQLVDLVVEDHVAEQIERVRARKEGGPGWNAVEPKYYVKTFPEEGQAEEVRQGFNPDRPETNIHDDTHTLIEERLQENGRDDIEIAVEDEEGYDETGRKQPWEGRRYDDGIAAEERDVWGSERD